MADRHHMADAGSRRTPGVTDEEKRPGQGRVTAALVSVLAVSVLALAPALFAGRIPAQVDWIRFYIPWIRSTADAHNPTGGDSFFVYLPDRLAAVQQWRSGQLPLWNPHVSSGVPVLGMQTANPLDPLLVLELLLPQGLALGIAYALLLFVGGLGVVLLLRDRGVRYVPALALAGAAFALNPYFVCYLESRVFVAGLATLPVTLWALDRVVEGGGTRRTASIAALGTGYAALSGNLQTLALFLLLGVLRVAWVAWGARARGDPSIPAPGPGLRARRGRSGALLGVVALGTGVAIGSLPLLAGVELLAHSTRLGAGAGHYSESNYLHWRAPTLWLSPDVLGGPAEQASRCEPPLRRSSAGGSGWGAIGILPFGLALLALIRRAGPARERVFWGGLAGLTLVFLFAMGTPLRAAIRQSFAWIDDTDLLRGLFVVNLGGVLLAGWGAAELAATWTGNAARRKWLFPVLVFFLGAAAIIAAGRHGVSVPHGLDRDIAPVLLAGASAIVLGLLSSGSRVRVAGAIWVLAALTVLELAGLHFRYNTFAPAADAFPPHPLITEIAARFGPPDHPRYLVSRHYRILPPNTNAVYQLPGIRGYTVAPIARYRALLECAEGRRRMGNQPFLKRIDSPIYRMIGATYLLSGDRVESPRYEPVATRWGPFFRRTDALPRAYLVHEVVTARDEAEMRRFLSDDAFDPAGRVYLEAAAGAAPPAAPPPAPEAVSIVRLEPTRVEIRATATAPGVLVLADPYYPGWRAKVDGREARILPANWGLRGVAIDAGTHDVVFTYRPRWFLPGAVLTLAALGIALLGAAPRRRNPDRRATATAAARSPSGSP
jgi:hypothetical protein